ncbi:MAG: hypothetical protein FWH35_00715 [Treponema sp.]|nr:hypothetical protein [Treponema sp.]
MKKNISSFKSKHTKKITTKELREDEQFMKLRSWKKCDLCQKTYNELLDFKIEWLDAIEMEIKDIEENKKKIKEINGYTAEKFLFLKKIDKDIQNMDIDSFVKQKKDLVSKEPKLQILFNFLKKNGYNNANILPFKNKEPIEMKRVKNIIKKYIFESENFKDIKILNDRIKMLRKFTKQLDAYDTKIESFLRPELIVNIINNESNENYNYHDVWDFAISSKKNIGARGILLCDCCLEIIKSLIQES